MAGRAHMQSMPWRKLWLSGYRFADGMWTRTTTGPGDGVLSKLWASFMIWLSHRWVCYCNPKLKLIMCHFNICLQCNNIKYPNSISSPVANLAYSYKPIFWCLQLSFAVTHWALTMVLCGYWTGLSNLWHICGVIRVLFLTTVCLPRLLAKVMGHGVRLERHVLVSVLLYVYNIKKEQVFVANANWS